MTNRLVLIAALTLAAGVAPTHGQAPAADMVLINGKVITLDDTSPILQAHRDPRRKSSRSRSDEDIRKRADARTKIIDLGGRTVAGFDGFPYPCAAGRPHLCGRVELDWGV